MDKIIGIGNALVDILVRLEQDGPISRLHLVKGGMQLIDEDMQREVTAVMAPYLMEKAAGGSAGNVALALAGLGDAPGFVGAVGDDALGRFLQGNCLQMGIVPHLMVKEGHTGVANTLITPDGERTFATCLGAAARMEASDVDASMLSGYGLVHVEGYLVQNPPLIEHLLQTAKTAGLSVSLDLASYNVVAAQRTLFRRLVEEYVDIVFANEQESQAFSGGMAPEETLDELASMCRVAVVKQGCRGSIACRAGERARQQGRCVKVVDTTAAGDFYAGGFLHAYVHGAPLLQCMQAGAAMAEEVIQVMGTQLTPAQWENLRVRVADILRR